MSFESVRNTLVKRLEEGGRGDRGWFVITRVHVAISWLRAVCEYLNTRSIGGTVQLSDGDYRRLADIIETEKDDPGIQLRRHHLLVMDKPLRLLRRVKGPSWDEIALTERGQALAVANDPATVLEQSLSEVRFAVEPWSPSSRVEQYNDFDVPAYEATKCVVQQSGGFIDRNEFDFFVSRIRQISEVDWAVEAISGYRELASVEQSLLHEEVRGRISDQKQYQNWRDVGLHTFSLFALGTSMVRDGTRLLLTSNWTAVQTTTTEDKGSSASTLKMPEPSESGSLLEPPAVPASNDGTDAESFVAKIFRSRGWTVAFYTNRRGFGFDLWARKGDTAIVIEVKSSVGVLGTVNLTATEYQAAVNHGENFVLALVENLDVIHPDLLLIQNPTAVLEIEERTSSIYVIPRTEWLRATENTD